MEKRSPHQDRIIRNYYQNLDLILVQRLGDLVTDLFLAEGAKRIKVWKRVGEILTKLKIPESRIHHLQKSDNPTLVAELLKELLAKGD